MEASLKLGNGDWGVKNDSLLAYDDFGGKFRPLPFDFTRASSATVVNKQGLIETVQSGIPRIDFNNDAKGALLLEPQSTNLVTYSEDFSNASWQKNNVSIVSNEITSPDGTLNADKFIPSTSNSNHRITNSVNGTQNLAVTLSVYAKADGYNFLRITENGSTGDYATFNLLDGIVENNTSSEAKIESVGNGWYRCSSSIVATTSHRFDIYVMESATIQEPWQGNGTSGVYIYGAQLEQNSFSTSYIPTTQGAISTRLADIATNSGNASLINSEEGTIYGEQKSLETNFTYNYFASVSDGTTNNRLEIRQAGTSLQFLWRVGGTYQGAITLSNAPFSSIIKYAVSYSSTDIAFYVNGSLVGTIDTPTLYSLGTLNNLELADGGGALNFRGKTKSLQVYKTALTDAQLTLLTTI